MRFARNTWYKNPFKARTEQVNVNDGDVLTWKGVLAANGEVSLGMAYLNAIRACVYNSAVQEDNSGSKALKELHNATENKLQNRVETASILHYVSLISLGWPPVNGLQSGKGSSAVR